MEKELIPVMLFLLLFGLMFLFIGAVLINLAYIPSHNELCQGIGYEEYKEYGGKGYCIDKDNNGHSMVYGCEGWFDNLVCNAKIITIGTIRTETSQKVKE